MAIRSISGFRGVASFSANVVLVLCASFATATPITYDFVNLPSAQNGWTVSGHITVDGLGAVSSGNITAWDFSYTNGTSTYSIASPVQPVLYVNNLYATPDSLLLAAYTGDPFNALWLGGVGGHVDPGVRWTRGYWGDTYLAFDPSIPGDAFNSGSPAYATVGSSWIIASVPDSVPEIDPSGLGAVLALVTGAVGLLERRRAGRA